MSDGIERIVPDKVEGAFIFVDYTAVASFVSTILMSVIGHDETELMKVGRVKAVEPV